MGRPSVLDRVMRPGRAESHLSDDRPQHECDEPRQRHCDDRGKDLITLGIVIIEHAASTANRKGSASSTIARVQFEPL